MSQEDGRYRGNKPSVVIKVKPKDRPPIRIQTFFMVKMYKERKETVHAARHATIHNHKEN